MVHIQVVHTPSEVRAQVERVAEEIAATGVKDLLLIIMLRGGMFFGGDLARRLVMKGIGVEIDFMWVSLYDDQMNRKEPDLRLTPVANWKNRDILIVDDTMGSGDTYKFAEEFLMSGDGAASCSSAVVINSIIKSGREMEPDYFCYKMNDSDFYRVGYGEDVNGRYRELPFIGSYPEDEFFEKLK